jgi:hypothetical protein
MTEEAIKKAKVKTKMVITVESKDEKRQRNAILASYLKDDF